MGLIGLDRDKITKILSSTSTYATILLIIAIDSFSTECLEWEPDALVAELEDDYGVKMPQINKDKLNALILALTSDMFYTDPLVFWYSCNVLSGIPVNLQSGSDEPTSEEVAWGSVEVALIDMQDGDNRQPEYSDDVRTMVGVILHNEGFDRAPQFLKFAMMPKRWVAIDPETEAGLQSRHKNLENDLELHPTHKEKLLKKLDSVYWKQHWPKNSSALGNRT